MRALKISAVFLACSAGALAIAPVRAEPAKKRSAEAQIERMCSERGKGDNFADMQAIKAARIGQRLKLTDAQKAAFKEMQDARAKARADAIAALCANKPDLSTFEKTLAFRDARTQLAVDAMKAAEPKLIAFYNSLDDNQKRQFEDILRRRLLRGKMLGVDVNLIGDQEDQN